MRRFICVLIGLLLISGCKSASTEIFQSQKKKGGTELSMWSDVSIQAPVQFKEKILRSDGSLAYTTYDTKTTQRNADDFAVHLYHSAPSCSPSSLGISQPEVDEVKDGESVMWGRVDAYPGDMYPVPEPNCMVNPPYTQMAASYMLCAEKMGKRVAICIMQVTDDQEAAEEIFSSFRWVKL